MPPVHALPNRYLGALLDGQRSLLNFGFQSNFTVIKELCHSSAATLDGRNDMLTKKKRFDPPTERWKEMGQHTVAVTGIKVGVIESMYIVSDLRTNYRLALLLGIFKSKVDLGAQKVGSWAESMAFHQEFEGLFEAKSPKHLLKDSAQLHLDKLSDKGDYDHALIGN